MRKAFNLIILIIFLNSSCKRQEKSVNECENFQVGGLFYQGEQVSVTFNSTIVYTDSFPNKPQLLLKPFCLAYTDTFNVHVRITKANKIVLDTAMVGYAPQGSYLLFVPRGTPRQPIDYQGLTREQQVEVVE